MVIDNIVYEVLNKMQGKQFYFKAFTTISVFSFFISYCIYVSTNYLLENVENFSSIGSFQLRSNVAGMIYNNGPNHELFNQVVSNKNSGKYTNKYKKTISVRKIRRELFSINPNITKPVRTTTPRVPKSFNLTKEEREARSDFLRNLKLPIGELRNLEKRTKKQYQVKEWHMERQKRLTSSSFGKAIRCEFNELARKKYIYFLLHGNDNYNKNLKYEIEHRSEARIMLEKDLNTSIRDAGLMVDFDIPYLAASPNGLVGRNGIVVIKCPREVQNMSPKEAITSKTLKFCYIKRNELYVKRNSNEFYQVQGQLHISRKMYCYFCLWTPQGIMYQKIYRNDTFFEKRMRKALHKFYLRDYLPALLTIQKK